MAPLIVVTGPTASGKSALAMELAEKYNGEIICADSRTIYIGMDIGTAKPTAQDQARVPHHLLDVVEPNQRFTAADFQIRARAAIADIRARGRVPFLVGGTGLYIDSVVLNYRLNHDTVDSNERARLEKLDTKELQALLKKHRIDLPENSSNKRYLIRAWEQKGINQRRQTKPDVNTHVVAITTEKETLVRRISDRAREMFATGVLDETRYLGKKYGWDTEAMSGNIYPILHQVIDGTMTAEQAIERFVTRDWQLAKRQITWLRRRSHVQWLSIDEAREYVSGVLDKKVC